MGDNKRIKASDVLFIGLALFATCFGAGNLIFPLMLGLRSGAPYLISVVVYFLITFFFAKDRGTTLTYPPRASHRDLSPEELAEIGITMGQICLSAGLEETSDLLADFDQALEKL